MNFKSILSATRSDIARNHLNPKGQLILLHFRIATWLYNLGKKNVVIKIFSTPFLVWYKVMIEWVLGVELPYGCNVGSGLIIDHGQGLVVNRNTRFGSNCRLRNGVTIGCKIDEFGNQGGSPIFGDSVDVGANAIVIGAISIGKNVKIGAGAVVVKDVPDDCVVVGNPAKIIPVSK